MAQGSRICPHCGGLNGIGEERCFRCGRSLPGAVSGGAAQLARSVLGTEYPITKFYLGVCFVVFALCVINNRGLPPLFGQFSDDEAAARWGLVLLRWGALLTGLGESQPWRLLSSMFVHMGILHLALNMMSFVDIGRMTESRLGSARYVLVFIATGVLGFLTSELWYGLTGARVLTAGASGGLFGLGGALVGCLYARKDPSFKDVLLREVVYAVVFALMMPVNNAAHVGGFVCGAILGFGLEKQKHPARADRLFAVLAAVLMLLSLTSIALSSLAGAS